MKRFLSAPKKRKTDMSYNLFSRVYDTLTENVEYSRRAGCFCSLLSENGIDGGLLLDLACGTGSLSVEFAKRGFSVIGVDISEDMLSVAQEKAYEAKQDILFLKQDMRSLDLFGTINCAVCALDSLNHLESIEDIEQTFKKVSLFLEDGGLFIFDMNTLYKHREILRNNSFIYDCNGVFCAWQNTLRDDGATVDINLDFFVENEDSSYSRFCESFSEKAYETDDIISALKKADFNIISILNDLTNDTPDEKPERVVFVARRNNR